MCDMSKFPAIISNVDELKAAYSEIRATLGNLTEKLAVCYNCVFGILIKGLNSLCVGIYWTRNYWWWVTKGERRAEEKEH
jgi:uncharacterized protein (UPF0264 family)